MSFLALASNVMNNIKDYGVNVTLSGLVIVFAMLVLLVFIIFTFGMIFGAKKSANKVKTPKAEKKKEVINSPVAVANTDTEDEDVIAAISAAVMMMYEGTGKTPIIRSIRPAQKGVRSAWATAGIVNNTRPF